MHTISITKAGNIFPIEKITKGESELLEREPKKQYLINSGIYDLWSYKAFLFFIFLKRGFIL